MQLSLTDNIKFDGSDIEPENDNKRLTGQLNDIYNLMIDGAWRTLGEIEKLTGHPQASISAQLRNFRKPRFKAILGDLVVNKQRRGRREDGLFEYQLSENSDT